MILSGSFRLRMRYPKTNGQKQAATDLKRSNGAEGRFPRG
jgi:hypothetical protein